MTKLEEIVSGLPPELQKKVEDFARNLAERHGRSRSGEPRRYVSTHGWAGALSHLRDKYASGVELQHDLLRDWEGDR